MQSQPDRPGANHPLAVRMGMIAFISQNLTIGCMFGTFGVLLMSIEAKLGMARNVSTLATPLLVLGGAVLAPIVGVLAGKVSLRLLMLAGSALGVAGYVLLAFAHGAGLYLLAYGLFVGPGFCLSGTMLPPTLVTRWFRRGRGRALGLMSIPVMATVMPMASAFLLRHVSLTTVYLLLAAIMALNLLPLLFIVDFPPSAIDPTGEDEAAEAIAHPGVTAGELLRSGRFWALTIGWASIGCGAVMLGAHLVPMASGWGIGAATAAVLLSVNALAAVGTPVFGWLADKLGGRMTLTILCFDSVALWALLLAHPPLPILAVVIGLAGLHAASAVPVFGLALSEQFGQGSFGGAYGLANTVSLPFTAAAVPLAGSIYVKTGSYSGAILTQTVFLLLAALLVLSAGGRRAPRPPAGAAPELA